MARSRNIIVYHFWDDPNYLPKGFLKDALALGPLDRKMLIFKIESEKGRRFTEKQLAVLDKIRASLEKIQPELEDPNAFTDEFTLEFYLDSIEPTREHHDSESDQTFWREDCTGESG